MTSFCQAPYPTTAPMLKDMTNNTTNDAHLLSSNTSNILNVLIIICWFRMSQLALKVFSVSLHMFFSPPKSLTLFNAKFQYFSVHIFLSPFSQFFRKEIREKYPLQSDFKVGHCHTIVLTPQLHKRKIIQCNAACVVSA